MLPADGTAVHFGKVYAYQTAPHQKNGAVFFKVQNLLDKDDEGIMVEDARIGYDESIRFFAFVAEIPAMYEYVDLKIAPKP